MGWLYTRNQTKEELIKHLLNEDTYHKAFDHSLSGNHLWAAFENHNPECPSEHKKYICLFLLASHRNYGWGYKDISESMGPCEKDCPLRFFDLVPDPGGFATAWREEVLVYHAAKKIRNSLLRSLRPGMEIKLKSGCRPTQVRLTTLKPLRGYADGILYRLQPKLIDSVISL